MTIFDLFATTNYTFLQLDSNVSGNVVVEEFEANGVVKLREGMVQVDNMEAYTSQSTVHIRPDEPFLATLDGNLVGHGIRVTKNDQENEVYRIEAQTEGFDFNEGTLEFIKVTLKKESVSEWQSGLSLT